MNLVRSSLKLFIARVSGVVLGFVGTIYFARELGASRLGTFFLFQAVVGILMLVTDFGMREAIEKRLSEPNDRPAVLGTGIMLKAGFLALVCLLIVVFHEPLENYIGADLAVFLILALVVREANELANTVLRSELRVGETAWPRILRRLSFLVLGIGLVAIGVGVRGLVYAFIAASGMTFLVLVAKTTVRPGLPDRTKITSLFSYAKYNFVTAIGGQVYQRADILIIGFLLTQSHVGVYEIAWRVAGFVMILGETIGTVLFPSISDSSSSGNIERIEGLFPKAISGSLVLIVPAFFGVLVLSEDILSVLFGSEFVSGTLVLVILMGEKIIQGVHVIVARFLHGLDRPDLGARVTVVSVTLNLLLNVLLIEWIGLGIVGAATATLISFGINATLALRYLSDLVTVSFPYRHVAWYLFSSVMMAGAVYGIQTVVTPDSIPTLLVNVFAGAAIYGVFVLFDSSLRENVHALVTDHVLTARSNS
jgi:O-antigen/teichoic acid export membrane protein